MSDFSGLRLALTALQSQQRAVDLAAQNVANVNTPGYTRQAVNLVNIGAPATPALYSKFVGDGQGVKVDSITKSNRDLLQRGHQAAREAIASMGEIDIDAYDAHGTLPDRSLALRIVDEAI